MNDKMNMNTNSYSTEPGPGAKEYKLSSMLRHYLETLVENSPGEIDTVLQRIEYFATHLSHLKARNINPASISHKALDELYTIAPAENKKDITCKKGCTACCYIDLHITADEAALILSYCEENNIEVDRAYLVNQLANGRSPASAFAKCVFLENSLCTVYPVRPAACRKHFVKSDPALCDSKINNEIPLNTYFDLHAEMIASANMNISETNAIEFLLLKQLKQQL
jgi:Fe-S-cluster containining protein